MDRRSRTGRVARLGSPHDWWRQTRGCRLLDCLSGWSSASDNAADLGNLIWERIMVGSRLAAGLLVVDWWRVSSECQVLFF
ncbi:unnamed protein product [Macrosiphum euphorbiae]|uniref:Uncharacterized protein n=1 Tax=Macrosiphum euphorbiae TaxID=13131 RepID=A0AAV0X064_9HEMI|nr:unnamed protein product [Macrosiphum euphorbiae]